MKAIVAMSMNRVIGAGNQIPWHLPEDFRWFRSKTLGHAVVLGRKTFEGLKKPLKNRINFVLTRHPEKVRANHPEYFANAKISSGAISNSPLNTQGMELPGFDTPDIRLASSLEVIRKAQIGLEIFICGGAQVYQQTLPECSDLFLTLVKRNISGDAFFPRFEDIFDLVATLRETPEFDILHYRNRAPLPLTGSAPAPAA